MPSKAALLTRPLPSGLMHMNYNLLSMSPYKPGGWGGVGWWIVVQMHVAKSCSIFNSWNPFLPGYHLKSQTGQSLCDPRHSGIWVIMEFDLRRFSRLAGTWSNGAQPSYAPY